MHHRLAARFVVVVVLAGPGCAMNADDAVVPDDLGPPPDLSAENAACEGALAVEWQAHPPVTGVGPAKSAGSYAAVIGKIMEDYGVPGGAVAVTQNGRLVLAKGFGFADVEQLQPAHPDQLFRLASLSKQITAAAVLQLVTAGKLSLDEPAFPILADLAPLPGKSVNPQLAQITVRHLLNHTGGWNRDFETVHDPMFDSFAISAALAKPGPASCADTIRYMLDRAPTYPAGTTYCYSNFGYCVLGRVIERRSGMAYDEYVKTSVLRPAAAERATLGKSLLSNRADDEVRYYPFPGEGMASSVFPGVGTVPWEYGGWAIEAMDAHGGWIASPVDMVRFALRVDGLPAPADAVTAEQLAQMLGNPNVGSCTSDGGTTPADPGYWYGFGWSVNRFGNHWHTGSLDGTATEDVTAANGFSWAAFFNTRPSDGGGFASRLDGDLWTALQGVKGWTDDDYFDQLPGTGFTPWMSSDAFASDSQTQSAAHRYAVRVEGRVAGGAVELRAEWAPLHGSIKAESAVQQDCLSYRARDAALKTMGYVPVAIQSFKDKSGRKVFQASWAVY